VAEVVTDFAVCIGKFLIDFGRRRERDLIMTKLASLNLPIGEGVTRAHYMRESQHGEGLLQQGQVNHATQVFRSLLAAMDMGMAYEGDYDRALTLSWLGRCLKAQEQSSLALEQQHRALAIFERLSASDSNAKQMVSIVCTDIADNFRMMGQFDDARRFYEAGLEIAQEINDQRGTAVKLAQLGALALVCGQLTEARRRYHEALQTFQTLGEPEVEAVAWHQLGIIAQQQEAWGEADRCYRESLRLNEMQHNIPSMANTSNHLAMVAERAGQLIDAENWYQLAVTLLEKLPESMNLASALNNRAILYLRQNRLDEARRDAERAAVLKEGLDLSAEPWTTFSILAKISDKQNRAAEAAQWRVEAHASQDAFARTPYKLSRIFEQFQRVIVDVVAVCQGEQRLKVQLEAAFDVLQQKGWQIAEPIRRIWTGERDPEALTAKLDYDSRAIILAILHRLGVKVPALFAELDDQFTSGAGNE